MRRLLFACFFSAAVASGCTKDPESGASKTAGASDTVVSLNDSIWVAGSPRIYPCDANGDGINDFAILTERTQTQTWARTNFRIVRLRPETVIHALAGMQDICADSETLSGYAGSHIHNCQGGGKLIRTDSFVAVVKVQAADLKGLAMISSAKQDTLLLYYSYTSYGTPYPDYIRWDYGYGAFGDTQAGYFCLSVQGQRYAYRLRYQLPYLLLEERRKF